MPSRPVLATVLTLCCALGACATNTGAATAADETTGGEGLVPEALDPALASPDIYTVLVESPRVRVLRATWQPGQTDKLHGHPPVVAYAISDIVGELTSEDGTVKPVEIKAGSALLEGPITGHTFKNLGTEPAHMLLVEQRK